MIEGRVQGREGIDRLQNAFSNLSAPILAGIRDAVITLRNQVEGRTPVGDPKTDPHSGQLKKNWSSVHQESGGFSFSNDVPYGVILEEGLYRRVGPRTIATAEGIFSTQAPRGILRPMIEDDEMVNRLVSGVAERLLEMVEQNAGA